MQGILESLIDSLWVVDQFTHNTSAMVIWTLAVFGAGIALGKKLAETRTKADTPTCEPVISFSDMSSNQLKLMESLYDCGDRVESPTYEVLELIDNGLIKDAEGYDLHPGDNAHTITLTSKGRAAIQDNHADFLEALEKAGLIEL